MTKLPNELEGTPAHITNQTRLQPAIHAWKIYLKDQDRSPHTIKAFIADLNLLDSYLPVDITLGEINLKELEGFTEWLEHGRGVPCSPKSLSRRITSIKSFFSWLKNKAYLSNPAEDLPQRAVTSPLPKVMTHPEIKTALKTADSLRHADLPDARPYTLLKLLLETSIKKGECLNVDLNHLEVDDPLNAFLFIRYSNPRYRSKERKLPLSPEWVEAFHEYVNQYQPEEHLFPWTGRLLEYILEDITQAAGLENRISFDMVRWTGALTDLIEGVYADEIRQKLGVSKVQFREVHQKLRQLAQQLGYALREDPIEKQ